MIRLRELHRAITRLRPHDSEIVVTGRHDRLRDRLVERLRWPGQVMVIAIDAYGTIGSHVRPFAGDLSRPFAIGTAKIARLSQCPIVPGVPVLLGPHRVAIHWGPIIHPPAVYDVDADQRVTNLVLTFLETAVGLRPDQYVLPLNNEREWDGRAMRWRPARRRGDP
jgi:lauroyl/myristoyl acyltransferase